MIPIPRCLAVVVSFLVVVSAHPATNSAWSLGVWQSEDGLPNNNIVGITQTPDGYLWLAMPSGMARFDGNHFEDFPTGSFATNYENQRLRTFLQTRDGGLAIGIEPGQVIFLDQGRTTVFTNNLPQATIESMVQDGKGALWVVYHGGQVYRLQNGVVTAVSAENLPRGNTTGTLTCDRAGQVWMSKGIETGLFRGGRFSPQMVFEKAGIRLAPARDGGIWAVALFSLYKLHENQSPVCYGRLPGEVIHGSATTVIEDTTGAVWIGTSANGLFRYDGSRFKNIPTSDREVTCLSEDREGNIWAGTGGGGLNRIRPRPIILENSESGAPFEAIQSICQDTNGIIWASTADGRVVRRLSNRWEVLSNATLGATMANCIVADRSGGLWIATSERKLFHWQDGNLAMFGEADGLAARVVHRLFVNHDNDLWICGESPDSLQVLHDGKFTTIPSSPNGHRLRTLSEDNQGNMWIGGDRGTLLKVSAGKPEDESALLVPPQKTVRCLHADADGSLWVGFSAGGLGRLKDGKFSHIDVPQGLYVGAIDQILDDSLGSIWFGSDQGIFRVRKKELNDVADGRASTLWSIHYGRSEGLPSVQAHYGDWPGALKSSDGHLWIPMRTGLAIVTPEKIHEDLRPPPVLVDQVTVDDKPVALYGGNMPTGPTIDLAKTRSALRLLPSFHRLEFEFTALSFGPPENIHFRYQLEGFDDHWHDAGNLRSAIYSRLAAGHYQFHVQGCNSDGIWNDRGVALSVTVAPFFWQTWWFRLVTLLVFTLAIVAVVRYVSFRRLRMKLQKLEQQAALDKERARIARDIHDDLGGSLTQVALLTGLALRDSKSPEKSTEHMQQISATTHQVIKSLDEIVWAVNPRNDTLPDLVNYLGQFAVEFLRTAGIPCQADLPDHPPSWPVTSETRHNLYLVVKETLNNIARHAHATEVRFRVDVTDRSAGIVIQDNGQGFANGQADAFADGVRNMRQRMEEIGGRFNVDSVPGKGTRVEIHFLEKK